jgi:hypothetical protein
MDPAKKIFDILPYEKTRKHIFDLKKFWWLLHLAIGGIEENEKIRNSL